MYRSGEEYRPFESLCEIYSMALSPAAFKPTELHPWIFIRFITKVPVNNSVPLTFNHRVSLSDKCTWLSPSLPRYSALGYSALGWACPV